MRKARVFISCGQSTDREKKIGLAVEAYLGRGSVYKSLGLIDKAFSDFLKVCELGYKWEWCENLQKALGQK